MDRAYSPLPLHALPEGARFVTPDEHRDRVQLDSPALSVMTDFALVPAGAIDSAAPADDAHRFMILRGVRLLLVTDEERRVLGIISAADLLGEKPVTMMMAMGIARNELRVRDVMTPRDRLDALSYDVVAHAQVGHIVVSLRKTGRQHALVSQREGQGPGTVRGLFSLSQIARQLGIQIPTTEIAQTFAEIEAALAR